MPITGDWWSQSQRPILKQGRAVTADVEQGDVASCAVTSGALAAGAVTCGALAAGAVGATATLGDTIVTSEKASTNLNTRSVLVFLEGATSTEAAGQVRPCSTTNAVWRPLVPVSVLRIQRYSLALEEMATCDNFTLYGNAGTCIGGILLSAGTTNPAAYTRTASGALTLTALAACTDVLVRRFSSTCSVQGRSAFQIDFISSG